jgi:hypothetical protein
MELLADILAEVARRRDEALRKLAAIAHGQSLEPGVTRAILIEDIDVYDSVLRQHGRLTFHVGSQTIH